MSQWFMTDDDCLQCCKSIPDINPDHYEFVQINSYAGHEDGKPFFQVAHGTIDPHKDYTDEEIKSVLHAYGYEDLDDFARQNSPNGDADWVYLPNGKVDVANSPSYIIDYQLIAEMLFETEVQEYVDAEFPTWNEAVDRIMAITGLSLSEHKEMNSSDMLIYGYEIPPGETHHVGFLSTFEEFAKERGYTPDELIPWLNNPVDWESVLYGEWSVVDDRFHVRLTPSVSEKPEEVARRIAYGIMSEQGFDEVKPLTPGTRKLLAKFLAPMRNAGLSNVDQEHNIMEVLAFREANKDFIIDVNDIFTTYGLLNVERQRQSVTQGSVKVTCNDRPIVTYGDEMWLEEKDGLFTNGVRESEGRHYGPVIGGWGSLTTNDQFTRAVLTQYPSKVQESLNRPSRQESLARAQTFLHEHGIDIRQLHGNIGDHLSEEQELLVEQRDGRWQFSTKDGILGTFTVEELKGDKKVSLESQINEARAKGKESSLPKTASLQKEGGIENDR